MKLENGRSAEIAVVGNEGIVKVALFVGGEHHAEPSRSPERGPRLSPIGTAAETRV